MKHINGTIFHLLVITVAVFGLYGQTVHFEFVLDDKIVIQENTFVQKGVAGIKEIFSSDSMTGFLREKANLLEGGRYRPLSLVVFAVGYEFFGLNPFYFHLLNIIAYLICCLLLYQTLLLLFKDQEKPNSIQRSFAFVATLLFAVHPTHTEVVANIKGLDEILALLFGTVTFLFTILYYDKRRIVYITVAGAGFLLSLLSKESSLPLLVAIPVSLYFFRNTTLKEVFKSFLLLLVPTAIYLLIRYSAMGFLLNNHVNATGIMNNPYFDATGSQKTGTILLTLLLYLKLLFFPHPLTHDYYPYHIELIGPFHPFAILAVAVLGSLVWAAVKGIKTRSKFAYLIFFFFITISIVSNVVVNVGAFMNERFLFIPSIAFSLLIVVLFEHFFEVKIYKMALIAVTGLMFLGFTYKSLNRIPDWRNGKILNFSAVEVSKNSARANCFYGVSLYNELLKDTVQEIKREKAVEALKYINRSLEIYPEYADALRMKAGLAAEEYKVSHDAEKLLNQFREILKVRHIAYVDEFSKWMERRTNKELMADYYFDVGYSIFAVQQHNFNLAASYLKKGYAINKKHRGILFAGCIVNYLAGNYKKAIGSGTNYTRQFGENAEVLYYMGNAQVKNGQPQIGRQNIEKAIQLNPKLKTKK